MLADQGQRVHHEVQTGLADCHEGCLFQDRTSLDARVAGGGHGVGEDEIPFREDQIGGDAEGAALAAFCLEHIFAVCWESCIDAGFNAGPARVMHQLAQMRGRLWQLGHPAPCTGVKKSTNIGFGR